MTVESVSERGARRETGSRRGERARRRLEMTAFLLIAGCSAAETSGTPAGAGGSTGAASRGGTGGVAGPVTGTGGLAGATVGGGTVSGGRAGSGGSAGSASGGGSNTVGGSNGVGGSNTVGGSNAVGGSGGKSAGGSGGKSAGGSGGANGTGGGSGSGGANGGRSGGGSGNGGALSGGAGGTGGDLDAVCPPGIARRMTVNRDGSGEFTTLTAAISSIANGSSEPIRIDVAAGTYTEKLTIANRSHLCLVGAGAESTIVTFDDSNAKVGSTSGSASVFVSANDFSAANLSFQNSNGPGSQAVALRLTGQRQQFLNCRFVGYQDTLYTHQGTQYFRDCYVQGNTDYVFGGATAVLDGCEVKNVEGGSAVAAPNTDAAVAYGLVFLGGRFTAASGVRADSVGLGRPWGDRGAAAYLHVELGPHIIPAGFVPMSGNQPENARFHEYESSGEGAAPRGSYQLTDADAAHYTIEEVLAPWVPSYSELTR